MVLVTSAVAGPGARRRRRCSRRRRRPEGSGAGWPPSWRSPQGRDAGNSRGSPGKPAPGARATGEDRGDGDGDGPGVRLASHRWQYGDLLRAVGRSGEARGEYEKALDDAESLPYDRKIALEGLAAACMGEGDPESARAYAQKAVELAEGMGDEALLPALEVLFRVRTFAGDFAAGRDVAVRALAAARRTGNHHRLFFALRNAALAAVGDGDPAGAGALLEEATPLAAELDRSRGGRRHTEELSLIRRLIAV